MATSVSRIAAAASTPYCLTSAPNLTNGTPIRTERQRHDGGAAVEHTRREPPEQEQAGDAAEKQKEPQREVGRAERQHAQLFDEQESERRGLVQLQRLGEQHAPEGRMGDRCDSGANARYDAGGSAGWRIDA